VADPEDFWDPERVTQNAIDHGWFYGDGTFPTREQIYKEVYTILERHPKLKLVLAHCFFISPYPQQMRELLDTYENVCVDLTPGPEMFRDFSESREVWTEMFRKYHNRFLFGTDINSGYDLKYRCYKVNSVVRFFTTTDTFQAFGGTVTGLGLEPELCEYIFSKSFLEFMNAEPKKIDTQALKAYVQRHTKHIPEGETKTAILQYCAEHF
jgi:hypothetical protein